MKRVTVFSFGYDGWGNSTAQLVKAVDAVERSRGYKRAVFVDTRIRRQGRAKGFIGTAFEDLLGPKRHYWMKDLGNSAVLTRAGPKIQIRRPAAATDLLDIALEAAADDRRVIFFCSCPLPRCEGKIACHRSRVATLLLGAARRRQMPLEVVEWPGGRPQQLDLELSVEVFDAIMKGRMSIPLPNPRPLAKFAALPWGSIATLRCNSRFIYRAVGPVEWKQCQWMLPIFCFYNDQHTTIEDYRRTANSWRREMGLTVRSTAP